MSEDAIKFVDDSVWTDLPREDDPPIDPQDNILHNWLAYQKAQADAAYYVCLVELSNDDWSISGDKWLKRAGVAKERSRKYEKELDLLVARYDGGLTWRDSDKGVARGRKR